MENNKEKYINGVQTIVDEVLNHISEHKTKFSDVTSTNAATETLQFVDLVQEGGG